MLMVYVYVNIYRNVLFFSIAACVSIVRSERPKCRFDPIIKELHPVCLGHYGTVYVLLYVHFLHFEHLHPVSLLVKTDQIQHCVDQICRGFSFC